MGAPSLCSQHQHLRLKQSLLSLATYFFHKNLPKISIKIILRNCFHLSIKIFLHYCWITSAIFFANRKPTSDFGSLGQFSTPADVIKLILLKLPPIVLLPLLTSFAKIQSQFFVFFFSLHSQ